MTQTGVVTIAKCCRMMSIVMDTGFEWVKVLLCAHMFQKRCISFAIRVNI